MGQDWAFLAGMLAVVLLYAAGWAATVALLFTHGIQTAILMAILMVLVTPGETRGR